MHNESGDSSWLPGATGRCIIAQALSPNLPEAFFQSTPIAAKLFSRLQPSAMSTTVIFSDLSVGEAVTGQFTDDYGITFTDPAAKVATDPKAPFTNVLTAAW